MRTATTERGSLAAHEAEWATHRPETYRAPATDDNLAVVAEELDEEARTLRDRARHLEWLALRVRFEHRPATAFTLIELIVTVVILGVLAALAIPAYSAVVERSRDAELQASMEAHARQAAAIAAFRGDGAWVRADFEEAFAGDGGQASDGSFVLASDDGSSLTLVGEGETATEPREVELYLDGAHADLISPANKSEHIVHVEAQATGSTTGQIVPATSFANGGGEGDNGVSEDPVGVLVGGDFTVSGAAQVLGDVGGVHANGDVTVVDNSWYVEQGITASGTVDPAAAGESGTPVRPVPNVDAAGLYGLAADPLDCYDESDPACDQTVGADGNPTLWWDLCADGTARQAASEPCAGTVVYDQAEAEGPGDNHLGWSFTTPGGAPEWRTTSPQSGVFYAHHTNARVEGSGTVTMTVIAVKDPTDDGVSGSVLARHSGDQTPAVADLALVADRDLRMPGAGGGGTLTAAGIAAAGEQADLAGTTTLTGTVYISGAANTANSPLSESALRGNFTVNANTVIPWPVP